VPFSYSHANWQEHDTKQTVSRDTEIAASVDMTCVPDP